MLGKIGSSDFYDFQKVASSKFLKTKPSSTRYKSYEKVEGGYLAAIDVAEEIAKLEKFKTLALGRAAEYLTGEKINEFGLTEEPRKLDNHLFGLWGEEVLARKYFPAPRYERQKRVEHDYQKAHLDFYDTEEHKIIEAKTVKQDTFSHYLDDRSLVKKKYEAQVQFQLSLLAEAKAGEIVVFNPAFKELPSNQLPSKGLSLASEWG